MASSTYTIGHPQRNGRRYVQFTVTLDDGTVRHTGDRGPFALPEDARQRTAAVEAIAAEIAASLQREHDSFVAERTARAAAQAKVAVELDAAIVAGRLTREDVERSGIVRDAAEAARD